MAVLSVIGGNGTLFVDEDKTFRLEVLDNTYNPAVAGSGIPVDITGWTILFDVRNQDASPAPAIFSKTATFTGTYNAVRSINTQRAIVTLSAAELDTVQGRKYRYSFKRMDLGSETVLAWGDFTPQKATAPL